MNDICIKVVKTPNGNKYQVDGVIKKNPIFRIGHTYTFLQYDKTNKTHPLNISSTKDGIHGGGTELNGVVITDYHNCRSISITIDQSTPDILYYYCENHKGMGSSMSITKMGIGFRRR